MTDIWSAICHGNPPHVDPGSFTTRTPEIDDLIFDEDVPEVLQDMVDVSSRTVDISTSARFLEMIKLSQILHELIHSYLYVPTFQLNTCNLELIFAVSTPVIKRRSLSLGYGRLIF
jgi:NCS1 family nucleobase:cation symporter-1